MKLDSRGMSSRDDWYFLPNADFRFRDSINSIPDVENLREEFRKILVNEDFSSNDSCDDEDDLDDDTDENEDVRDLSDSTSLFATSFFPFSFPRAILCDVSK